MEKDIKRRANLPCFAIIIFVLLIHMLISAQKVSAEVQSDNPYLIKVNRIFNTITVYEKDENGQYKIPIKAMVCSVGEEGTQTKLGTFQTKAKYRWKELMGKVYGQYSTRIVGGILFHSVYYYQNGNPATLATKEYNKLGSAASHGCIRLTVEDAKWIYDNCPVGTTVIVYDDKKSAGPLGKPETIKIPTSVRWDPTDPSNKNPYAAKKPYITGVKNRTISWGATVDLIKGVTAKSTVGLDITPKIAIEGEVNPYVAGDYKINYSVIDVMGRTGTKTITVTVRRSKAAPFFEGINDRVLTEGTVVDEALALEGVKAFCSDIELKQSDIKVDIQSENETQYFVTYSIDIGKNVITTETVTFQYDKEAPVITGVSDRILNPDEIPDETMALIDVTVSDNLTIMEPGDITVEIITNPDGSYQVTYTAVDDMGNEASTSALFHY
ncbi:MAG: hypothetical protein K0S76_1252 [Herbinix sp.]|jgi:hypothetical protein|nr:hypothetical protein [Herbinix sp.]